MDSEKTNIDSAVLAMQDLGITLTDEDKKQIIARHTLEYGKDFLKKYVFDFDRLRELQRNHYYNFVDDAPLFTRAIECAKRLKKDFKIALSTSSSKDSSM